MSSWLIALTGCIYVWISVEQLAKGNTGLAVTYFGYALGNVGLYMMAR